MHLIHLILLLQATLTATPQEIIQDDTPRLQQALNNQATVELTGPATYHATTLHLPANTTLTLDPGVTLTLSAPLTAGPGATLTGFGTITSTTTLIDTQGPITLTNLTLRAPLSYSGAAGLTIDNLKIITPGPAITIAPDSSNILITHTSILTPAASLILPPSSTARIEDLAIYTGPGLTPIATGHNQCVATAIQCIPAILQDPITDLTLLHNTLYAILTPTPPTQPITFYDNAQPLATTTSPNLPLPPLTPGHHILTARYANGPVFGAIPLDIPGIALTLAQNPIPLNARITANIQVTADPTPTGIITLQSGPTILATAPITAASGPTAYATLYADPALLGPGTYPLTATWLTTTSATVPLTITRSPTTLTLTPSATQLPLGTPLTLTANLTGQSPALTPTGTITFTLDGTPFITLPAAPTVQTTIDPQPIATYTLAATYNPTGIFAPSTAPTQTLTVTPPLAVSWPTPNLSMPQNSTADLILLITPLSNFSGPLTTTCTTPVPYLTCTITSPATINTPTQATLHLTTTQNLAGTLPIPLTLAALLLLTRRTRKLLPLLLLTACAQGGDFGAIPTGTHLVTVTLTAAAHPLQTQCQINILAR